MMYGFQLRDPQVFGTLAAAGLCLGGIATYVLLRRRPSPDEIERERRAALVQRGRIIDATLLDISDLDAQEAGRPQGMQLILYRYEIAGVVYECSQDVTMLRHLVNIYDCRLGFPASVRYDPHHPGNSLIVAETWSGLRDTASSVPVRQGVPTENVIARTGSRKTSGISESGKAAKPSTHKAEPKPEPKSEVKSGTKSEAKSETRPEAKSGTKPDSRPDPPRSEAAATSHPTIQ